MRYCLCGNAAIETGAECARCRALRTLGLQAGATDAEIRTAYHVLVKVWHPDRFQHDPTLKTQADEKLKGINSAFRYLTSNSAREEQRQAPASAHDSTPPAAHDASGDEPSPVRPPRRARADRFAWISLLNAASFPPIVVTCTYVAAFAVIGWILFKPIDRLLASEPLTAGPYEQCKIEVRSALGGIGARISDDAGEIWHSLVPRKSSPAVPAAPQQEPNEPAARKTIRRQSNTGQTETVKVLPYITAGLSKDEVIAVQGPPTSSSENRLIYGRSELDFSGDRLVGWKIDPASPSIRVKLWPDAAVDPDLDTFWVGSSKNEVLAVQGTPTFWSENTFGYGGSEVYFKDGRVVSWKNDPATVPLRAARR